MSNRPQPAVRTSLSRLAIAGAATLASVLSMAPAAVAADAPITTEPTQSTEPAEQPAPPAADETDPAEEPVDEPPATDQPETTPTPDETKSDAPLPEETTPEVTTSEAPVVGEPQVVAEEVAAGEVTADFGFQKFRVGAKIADGSYVPAGTTTEGSTFEITYTDVDGNSTSDTCTTGAPDSDDITYCPVPVTEVFRSALAASSVDLTPGNQFGPNFIAAPGTTVSISQTSAPDGLVAAPESTSLEPCDNTDPFPCNTTDVVFSDTGVLPSPVNDNVDTEENTPVTIDVLGNDDSADPATTIAVAASTANGSAAVVTEGGQQQIRYTPNTDYNGHDTFTYTVTNSNGSSTASVTVDVRDVAPVYGTQKYRVGVQIANGSYVPVGTTTVNSEFTITTKLLNGTSSSVTCTTVPSDPTTGSSNCGADYIAPAGSTITVVQATAAPGLTPSTETRTILPCNTLENECSPSPFGLSLQFTNTGLLATTHDDQATTQQGEPIRIDVLANDESADPDTGLSVDADTGEGTAKVVGEPAPRPTATATASAVSRAVSSAAVLSAVPSAGTLAIMYTPKAGFSGTDTFKYTVANSNGTRTGTVTVQVLAGVAVVVPGNDSDVADGSEETDDAVLPDTGGADLRLLGLGGLLLAGGGWLTARGRRRRDSVHAG